MVKIFVNRYVSRRIIIIRREIETNTQKIRKRTLENLEEIFRMAAKIAKGDVRYC